MLSFDITAVVLVACLFNFGDAQITGWSSPSEIASAASGTLTTIIKAESIAVGDEIAQFTAATTSGEIDSYELLTTGTPFSLSTGGLLTLSTALDYETATSHIIEVKVTDNNGTPNSGTATLTITVTDVNEAPAFGAASYTVCVTDGLAADTSVTTFSATDEDSGDTITYSINSGDTNTNFKIATAELQVNTGKTLERATTATYTLVVRATDDDGLFGSATYTINVQTSCSSGAAALTMTFITLFLALISSLN